ncbi:hypothetical protein COOONC_03237 [Cooperia oncophora]
MTKALSRKEIRAEAAVPKRRAIPIMKAKISIKENDRIARMKAAREAYRYLTQDFEVLEIAERFFSFARQKQLSDQRKDKNEEAHGEIAQFLKARLKPMASSLEAIRNGGIRTETGRASYIAGARSLAPRPSLLPLGINIFESNVSFTDKMKVRNFIESCLEYWDDSKEDCTVIAIVDL